MTERHPHRGPPRLLYSLAEGRALLEMGTLPVAWPFLMSTPRGDGHPVLLLPGFMAGEMSLFALKSFLRGRGHDVRTWGLGQNPGLHSRHIQALEQTVRHLHHQTGRRVSLVGWSLGGVFALLAAHHASDCVRSVITLGGPVSPDPGDSSSAALVKQLYRWVSHPMGTGAHVRHPRMKRLREHELPPVPMSCLYSLSDGVVPPQEATLRGDPALHENIRVPGSHIGMVFNARVLAIVADRLAQPEGAWQPYRPSRWGAAAYRGLRRFITHTEHGQPAGAAGILDKESA